MLEKRNFLGGIDTDSEQRLIANGDYAYSLNIRSGSSDKDSIGAIENTKGNSLVTVSLPTGNPLKVIGAYEDKANKKNYYFLSAGGNAPPPFINPNAPTFGTNHHTVYEYDQQTNTIEEVFINDILNFDINHLITGVNVLGGDLYFTDDFTNPKCINIQKGKNYVKRIETFGFYGYATAQSLVTGQTRVTFYNTSLNFLFAIGDNILVQGSLKGVVVDNPDTIPFSLVVDFFDTIPSVISDTFPISSGIGGTLELDNDSYAIFDFKEEYITAIRKPPSCNPTVAYGSDSKISTNYLENQLFQFKYRWIYFDHKKSSDSPISYLPIPTINCGNTITVNNNIQITVDTGSNLVDKIEIFARKGNIGDFFSIDVLVKEEKGIADDTTFIYGFYNDKTYVNEDLNVSNKLYDFLPRLAKGQDIIEGNRITYGNILENFDLPVIDASLVTTYQDQPEEATPPVGFDLTGFIRILNATPGLGTGYNDSQPIYTTDGGNTIQWGGLGIPEWLQGNIANNYRQILPLKGFVAYLAGTDYYAISTQNGDGNVKILEDGSGIFDTGSSDNIVLYPGNQCSDSGVPFYPPRTQSVKMRCAVQNQQVEQTFTLKNVPAGKYILRFASHLTTTEDLLSENRSYQDTSTNVSVVCDYGVHEVILEVVDNGFPNPPSVYTNGNLRTQTNIGNSRINDLSNPRTLQRSSAITGYVTDRDITTPDPDTAGYLADTRIELADVTINRPNDTTLLRKTDHNGYFWGAYYHTSGNNDISIVGVQSGAYPLSAQQLNYDFPTSQFTPFGAAEMRMVILRNTNSDVSNFSRTQLQGQILDSNNSGLIGTSIIIESGTVSSTDVSGRFQPFVYANTPAVTRGGIILFGSQGGNCGIPVINTGGVIPTQDNFSITLGTTCGAANLVVPPYTGTYNGITDASGQVLCPVHLVGYTGLFKLSGQYNALKRGGDYQYGLVYYDNFNRSTSTITNDGLKRSIAFYSQPPIQLPGIPVVEWNINHLPPAYATHYQWVRTKNRALNRYLQFLLSDATIVTGDGPDKLSFYFDLFSYKTRYPDSVLTYDFVTGLNNVLVGDRIRFIMRDAISYTDYIDLEVIKYDSTLGRAYVYYDTRIGDLTGNPAILVEAYTPKLQETTDIFWEIGECYPIFTDVTGTLVHGGSSGDQHVWNFLDNFVVQQLPSNPNSVYNGFLGFQSPTNINPFKVGDKITIKQNPGFTFAQYNATFTVVAINIGQGSVGQYNVITDGSFLGNTNAEGGTATTPANGKFFGGDAYYRFRSIPQTNAPTTTFKSRLIDDAGVSDFYESKVSDIGRPNKVDVDFRETRRISTIYYSERFVQETNINGLNSFFDINFEVYNDSYGPIQKMYANNHRLEVYQELRVGAIPINENVIIDNVSQGLVGTSALVLNKIQYYDGEYGIGLNPESFAVYGNRKYFTDVRRGVVLRLSIDGLTPISEYKMHNFVTDLFKTLSDSNSTTRIYGAYDTVFNEYIMALEPNAVSAGVTLAFNERNNRWSTFYSYLPEFMVSSNLGILSFKSGNLFTHNTNGIYNNFYGVQFHSEIHVPSNGEPSFVKVFKAVSEETANAWECPQITTPEGQLTNLITTDFELIEGLQYASLWMDTNTPNISSPLIEGDPLRSTSALFKFKNTSLTFVKLYSVNFGWIVSMRSNS